MSCHYAVITTRARRTTMHVRVLNCVSFGVFGTLAALSLQCATA